MEARATDDFTSRSAITLDPLVHFSRPEDPALQKFTLCLPELSEMQVSETTERIVLEPYGSTKLRVTIFPELKG